MVKTFGDFGIDLGSKTGTEVKVTCPQCSPHRKKKNFPCLNVNPDKGVWNCWHCGWSGTLKGGEWQRPEIRKVYTRPAYRPAEQVADGTLAWFEKRGISAAVVQRNRISKGREYFPQVEEERDCIMFPYYRGEEVVNVKYRTKDKLFRMAAGAERVLYGINDIHPEMLIWVEGEIDKLSVEMTGVTSCVSVPDGAPAPDSRDYAHKFDYLLDPALDAVEKHMIAVDNDAPGVRLKEELVRRLGPDRCFIVRWPEGCKDANEVLTIHGADVLTECLRAAEQPSIEGTFTIDDIRQAMVDRYQHGSPCGVTTGWSGLDKHYRVMPGEWTLVTGVPSSGKSEWLDALAVNLAQHHGWTFGVFSPENQPLEYHSDKLIEKHLGKSVERGRPDRMTPDEYDEGMDWLNRHFTFILPENPTVDGLIEIGKSLVKRKGIRGMIVDPWNEIDHMRAGSFTETEYISQCLTKFRKFARENGVHVWIVAHPRILQKKTDGTYPVPTPYDVSGSAHWRNKADNCITVHRDQINGGAMVEVHVQKVRKKQNGRIGLVDFRYNYLVGQYTCETTTAYGSPRSAPSRPHYETGEQ
ncbi:DnaB-like helicase C-terminal domain-containing protein [Paraburkholderia azotifigens]|uniref:DnaB-like helicase C-terminal domain-containing protein n=1 Tax=Paraburkholderia azotifigens TaxID=2057004 RepID=UPI0038BABFEE